MITKRQEWTFRLMLEMRESPFNYFVTLTYDQEHLPSDGVSLGEVQRFMKRLRKRLSARSTKVRFFAVGEYGSQSGRAHYHLLLFTDREIPCEVQIRPRSTVKYWSSADVEASWYPGCRCECVPVLGRDDNGKVASYVAGYVLKKLSGARSLEPGYMKSIIPRRLGDYWQVFVLPSWRVLGKNPEFATMSTKPGIGVEAIDRIIRSVKKGGWLPSGCEFVDEDGVALPVDHENVMKMHMLRLYGKLWPIGRTMREKMIKAVGAQKRTRMNLTMAHLKEYEYVAKPEIRAKVEAENKTRARSSDQAVKNYKNAEKL